MNGLEIFICCFVVWAAGIGFLDHLDLEFFSNDGFPIILIWPVIPIFMLIMLIFLTLATPFLVGGWLATGMKRRLKKARVRNE